MTAGTNHVDHPAHRRTFGTRRIVSMVAAATHRSRTTSVGSHAGQLGRLRETEIGRRTGARI